MNELGLAIIGLRNLQTFNMCCICPLEVNIVSTVKKLLLHLVLSQTINCPILQSNSTYMCGLYHNGSRSAIEMLLLQRFQVIESLVLIMILQHMQNMKILNETLRCGYVSQVAPGAAEPQHGSNNRTLHPLHISVH